MGFFSFRKWLGFFLLILIALSLVLSFGPFFRIDPSKRSSFKTEVPQKDSLIIAGTEEGFYYPQLPAKKALNISFAYIHGFSASRPEISPVIEDVGAYFGAPVYFARLAGHGIYDQGDSLSQGHCFDWMLDSDRVIKLAKLRSRSLVLVGMSFGGLMSTFASLEHPQDIKALILISPIFELPNPVAKFVSGPIGPLLARLILGDIHDFTPKNEMNAKFWTTHYSTKVVPQLMDCANYVRAQDLSKIRVPLLVLYSDKDEVVNVDAIKSRFNDFGSSKKLLVQVPGSDNHVLTGHIMSPGTIPFVETTIERFIEENLGHDSF